MRDEIHLELPPGDPAPSEETDSNLADKLMRFDEVVPRMLVRPPERGRPLQRHLARPDDIVEIEDRDGAYRVMRAEHYDKLDRSMTRDGGAELGIRAFRVLRVTSRRIAELLGIDKSELKERIQKLGLDQAGDLTEDLVADAVGEFFQPLFAAVEDLRTRALSVRSPGEGPGTLYRMNEEGELVDGSPPSGRSLLLLHGTWSAAEHAFRSLTKAKGDFDTLRSHFDDRVMAFQHRTLSQDPIDNALTLAHQLPEDSRLTILAHSRGGLIAELLSLPAAPPTDETPPELLGRLRALHDVLENRRIVVDRIARVAAPMAGTVLLGRRLDRSLSIVMTALNLAAGWMTGPAAPVTQQVLAFVKTVSRIVLKYARHPKFVPGIAAQRPQSPLVRFLNHPQQPKADGKLAVVAGDVTTGGSLQHSIKVLLAKAFFGERNDFVVQVKGMYGGFPRKTPVLSLYERTPQTTHGGYFHNESTRRPIARWLRNLHPPAFVVVDSPDDPLAGERGVVKLAARLESAVVDRRRLLPQDVQRDTVVVLPGIMGSHLAKPNGERIWYDYGAAFEGRTVELAIGNPLQTEGLLRPYYGDLVQHLSRRYRVRTFPYDWRLSVTSHADRLLELFRTELQREGHHRVHVIAHSMGGLVMRAFMKRHAEVWDEVRRRGSRLVLAGTPNRGAYDVLQMLGHGEHTLVSLLNFFVRTRAVFGSNAASDLRVLLKDFPGVLELLPQQDDVFRRGWWERSFSLKEELLPSQAALDAADEVTRTQLADVPDDAIYLAGHARITVTGFKEETGQFERGHDRGDGSVPWQGSIAGEAWYVPASHEQILGHKAAFRGIEDLLDYGRTRQLVPSREAPHTRWWASRSDDDVLREVVTHSRFAEEGGLPLGSLPRPSDFAAAFAPDPEADPDADRPREPLMIGVSSGNLIAATWPIVVGHFEGEPLMHAEDLIDELMDRRLRRNFEAGSYPGRLGSSLGVRAERPPMHGFAEPPRGRPPGALVIGLGEVGQLTARGLRETVRAAVLRYLLDREDEGQSRPGLSFLLIGSQGSLSIRDSVRAIVAGCLDADERRVDSQTRLSQIEFVELYEDAALEAHHAVQELARGIGLADRPTRYVEPAAYVHDLGDRLARRPTQLFHLDWPHRALVMRDRIEDTLRFEILTKRAATERTDYQPPTWSIVMEMVREVRRSAGNPRILGRDAGEGLHRTLIPPQWQAAMREDLPLMIVLDDETAQIPWERVVDANDAESGPPAVRFPLVRQLSSTAPPQSPRTSRGKRTVLLAGNFETGRYALPGADSELRHLATWFEQHDYAVEPLIGPAVKATQLLTALQVPHTPEFVHLAAHGRVVDNRSGIVLPEDEDRLPRLDSTWLSNLDPAPRVAFLNTCHSGHLNADPEEEGPQLAVSLARALIQAGTEAVIVAGWPVNDQAARAFAVRFWERLLDGVALGEAVVDARRFVWANFRHSDTWAAYQVYGNAGLRLESPEPEFPGSPNALRDMLHDLTFLLRGDPKALKKRVESLLQRMPERWQTCGPLCQAMGHAWLAANQPHDAVGWFDHAVSAEDGPFCAAEWLLHAWTKVLRTMPDAEAMVLFSADSATLDHGVWKSDANGSTRGPVRAREAVRRLDEIRPTIDARALLGSASKDQAARQLSSEQPEAIEDAEQELHHALTQYRRSAELSDPTKRYYPLLAALGIEVARTVEPTEEQRTQWNQQLTAAITSASLAPRDYWSTVAFVDAKLTKALIHNDVRSQHKNLVRRYDDVRPLVSSNDQWRSTLSFIRFLSKVLDHAGRHELAEALRQLLAHLED
ncbi:MAG: CHAT domain-containing protein [Myxococcota bacterium]